MRKIPFATSAATALPQISSTVRESSTRNEKIIRGRAGDFLGQERRWYSTGLQTTHDGRRSRFVGHRQIGGAAFGGRPLRLDELWNRNAVTYRRHLGKYGNRDLRRRLAADLEPDRIVQAVDFLLRQ